MNNLIFHEYALSPFSEKIRRLFAFKGVRWQSVEQPIVAPKPDLTPLTGGYRRIPVLQIGADIYCDTALIARVVERLHDTPSCLPPSQQGVIALVEDWADHRFFMQVVPPVVVKLLPNLPPEFFADRAAMSPGFKQEQLAAAAPHAWRQARQSLLRLDQQLQASAFLCGDSFSLADAACYHCVWFIKNSPMHFAEVMPFTALARWFNTIERFAGDTKQVITAAQALAVARDSSPQDIAGGCVADQELSANNQISIVADDYGNEQTIGRLVRLSSSEIVITREDEQVGTVAVHYPRAGYRVSKV